jgi:hypothetical protein
LIKITAYHPRHRERWDRFVREAKNGVLVYESSRLTHVQYVGSTTEGRDLGAVDLVYEHPLGEYEAKAWFDFGKSTDKEGHSLNTGLIASKEGFGARGVAYDFYELRVAE